MGAPRRNTHRPDPLKKVIIISYYFPPTNFVGAERTAAWAKYLQQNGYYPIILTRCWNEGQTDPLKKIINNNTVHEKHESYEVYRLPIRRTLRDKVSAYLWLAPIQKALTLMELILVNYFIRSLPYVSIYRKAKELLKTDPEIKVVIASGRPFQSFFIGCKLKEEFDINWIPDYRDEWNSHQNPTNNRGLWKLIQKLELKSELKWTANADGFLTVSDNWRCSIEKLIHKKGSVVMNGYDIGIKPTISQTFEKKLNIIYAGTLYPSQRIDLFITSLLDIPDFEKKVSVSFIGANIIPEELNKLKEVCGGSTAFHFIDRLKREKLSFHVEQADLLILTSFEKVKGWYPVKLFEYYASGKPIFLCPSDQDVMEEFIVKTNSGFVANTQEECMTILLECIEKKERGETIQFERNLKEGAKYSRKHQTKLLADFLDTLTNEKSK